MSSYDRVERPHAGAVSRFSARSFYTIFFYTYIKCILQIHRQYLNELPAHIKATDVRNLYPGANPQALDLVKR
jgi:hypothetical protein